MTAETQAIANGGEPVWSHTYEHPEHGPLTFTVKRTPTNADWLRHSTRMAQLAPGVLGSNSLFAAACAGIGTIIPAPVVTETRHDDPDVPGHVTLEQEFYDPLADLDTGSFVLTVWIDYTSWRAQLLASTADVKNSSGAMSLPANDGASPAATTSPPPIPA